MMFENERALFLSLWQRSSWARIGLLAALALAGPACSSDAPASPAGGAGGSGGDPVPGDGGGAPATGQGGAGAAPANSGGGGAGGAGGEAPCVAEAPPEQHAPDIDRVWDESRDGILGLDNLLVDQMHEQGYLNYCVRYASSAPVSRELRDQIAGLLQRTATEWNDQLAGYNCWPHPRVETRVVGWAVADRETLQWPDGEVPVYVGDLDNDGEPKCPDACSRFAQRDRDVKDYSACPGGEANHFDVVFWLSDRDFGAAGHGGDWGQRLVRSLVTDNATAEHLSVELHEFGHGLGFPDFYHWENQGMEPPSSVMWYQERVTEWDRWMLRRIWDEVKTARYP